MDDKRVVVVGAGPNGLAAGVVLARAGLRALVLEAMDEIGGGTRSAELTLPGFLHDVCSSVHPMGAASPFLRELSLSRHGLEWVHPEAPLAHPFDDGTAALLERSTEATATTLDREDRSAYPRLMDPLVRSWEAVMDGALAPLLRVPRHPIVMARLGVRGLRSATGLTRSRFTGPRARALLAGLAAHAPVPLERPPTAAFAVMLAVAGHAVGWPFARGGSQNVARALAAELLSSGGQIETGRRIDRLGELPRTDAVLLDLTPRQVLRIAGDRLPRSYRRGLAGYRYGPGVFKLDWALSEPIPWRARGCARAGTVHLGGSLEEIAGSVRRTWRGHADADPFVLVAQPTCFDASRAPAGKHVAWGYIRVPRGSGRDFTDVVERQIERFAPGFQDVIIGRSARTAVDLERHNPNLVGGDITGGSQDMRQLFFRPVPRIDPYSTPVEGLYLCSSSTPPGGGVHGMCGFHAAHSALRRLGSS